MPTKTTKPSPVLTDDVGRPIVESVDDLRRFLAVGQRIALVWADHWQPGADQKTIDPAIVREHARLLTVKTELRSSVVFSATDRDVYSWHVYRKDKLYRFDADGFEALDLGRAARRYQYLSFPAGSHAACQTVRRKFIRTEYLNLATGKADRAKDNERWVTEPCGGWNNVDPKTGLCGICSEGWEVPGNYRLK